MQSAHAFRGQVFSSDYELAAQYLAECSVFSWFLSTSSKERPETIPSRLDNAAMVATSEARDLSTGQELANANAAKLLKGLQYGAAAADNCCKRICRTQEANAGFKTQSFR
jgi:hypothetical protein